MATLFVGFSLFALSGCNRFQDQKPKGTNAYQAVTGETIEEDRSHWDALFNKPGYVFGKEPADFLKDHVDLLPPGGGLALDIAMGEGRNAVFLAKKGFRVDGVDISEVALRKAKLLARENHVSINAIQADLNQYVIKPNSYDVIIVIHYLQRSLIPQIKRGLKKGGIVVFENETVEQLKNAIGQNIRRDYLLDRDELRKLFEGAPDAVTDFRILVYRETNDGKRAVASLVAKKLN